MSLAALTAWWFTYLVHSSLLGLLALVACRFWGRPAARVVLLRGALLGGLVTASLVGAVGGGGGVEVALPQAVAFDVSRAVSLEASTVSFERAGSVDLGTGESAAVVASAPPHSWRRWLLSGVPPLLLAASASGLARLALRERRARRALRANTPSPLSEWPAAIRALLARTNVRLELAPQATSPMALGRRAIVVPERARTELRDEELEALVAHELAHLERRDPLWLGVARIVVAATWFQPFNVLLLRRLVGDTELAADAHAVERTNNPLALARCLEQVGAWLVPAPTPLTSATMGSGSLLRRTEAVLCKTKNERMNSRAALFAASAGLALLACEGPRAIESDSAPSQQSAVRSDEMVEAFDLAQRVFDGDEQISKWVLLGDGEERDFDAEYFKPTVTWELSGARSSTGVFAAAVHGLSIDWITPVPGSLPACHRSRPLSLGFFDVWRVISKGVPQLEVDPQSGSQGRGDEPLPGAWGKE